MGAGGNPGKSRGKVLVLLGPPGSGKGTQSKKLAAFLRVPHISTGDLLRDNIRGDTGLGRRVDTSLRSGSLVSDKLVLEMLSERIECHDCAAGFILDGFPRTVGQARALDRYFRKVNGKGGKWRELVVIQLVITEALLLQRVVGRRVCPLCSGTYNIHTQRPMIEDHCDKDGTLLVARADDNKNAIRVRLMQYEKQSRPVINYYVERQEVKQLNADQSVDEVTIQLIRMIGASSDPVINSYSDAPDCD